MGELVAVYGTLRRGGRLHHRMGIATGRAHFVGTAAIDGAIYEVEASSRDRSVDTSYPCLVMNGRGRVLVELYELLDDSLLDELDELEGYDATRPESCEYVRRRARLRDMETTGRPADDAWTYEYVARPPDPARLIADGDWIAWVRGQARGSSYL